MLIFNFSMERLGLRYTPQFDQAAIERNLQKLFVSHPPVDRAMEGHVAKLAKMFRAYCASYPYGLWAPGLVVTGEMRLLTELYLPLAEIRHAFEHLFAAALRFVPFRPASLIHTAANWLDVLDGLLPVVRRADPASLLLNLTNDEVARRRFLFGNFQPARYGGGFGRYPAQASFLRKWLTVNRPRLAGGVRCLDAACGSGEGTYELAMLIIGSGFAVDSLHVGGATIEPLELFAAAHGYFPHDPERQSAYRARLGSLVTSGAMRKIVFTQEDLSNPAHSEAERYDVILCNGLLGGPFLHAAENLRETVERLARRLRAGGILLAADRFHGGWKKRVSDDLLRSIWKECGLRLLPVAEGIAGMKAGKASDARLADFEE